MKDEPYVALAYMTGILPIRKSGRQLSLNMFSECSMMYPREFSRFTGFTEDEVMALCNRYGRSVEEFRAWYGGYIVSGIIPIEKRAEYYQGNNIGHRIGIFRPQSVVEALSTGQIMNYWSEAETNESLSEYVRKDCDGLKEAVDLLMDGERLRIDISTRQNDMITFRGKDDVLSFLIHFGYLGYDDENREAFIPNREALDEFRSSLKGEDYGRNTGRQRSTAQMFGQFYNKPFVEITQVDIGNAEELDWGEDVGGEELV